MEQEVMINDTKSIRSDEFKKEKDFSQFIVENIDKFCRDVLGDEYVSHELEVQSSEQVYFMPRMPRADLFIKCKTKQFIVELKNPKNTSENRAAIGQILCYGEMLESRGAADMVIVTTRFDMMTARAIKKYALPIRYVYFDGEKCIEFLRDQ